MGIATKAALQNMDNSTNTSVTEDSSMSSKASIDESLDESLNNSLCSIDYYKKKKAYIQERARQETTDDVDEIDTIVELALSLENTVDNDEQRDENKIKNLIGEKRIQQNQRMEKIVDKAIYIVGCYWIVA